MAWGQQLGKHKGSRLAMGCNGLAWQVRCSSRCKCNRGKPNQHSRHSQGNYLLNKGHSKYNQLGRQHKSNNLDQQPKNNSKPKQLGRQHKGKQGDKQNKCNSKAKHLCKQDQSKHLDKQHKDPNKSKQLDRQQKSNHWCKQQKCHRKTK